MKIDDAAAPDAGLDQVARHVVGDDALDAVVHVVEPLEPDHRLRELRPVLALGAYLRPVEVGLGELRGDALGEHGIGLLVVVAPVDVERPVQRVRERALEQREIALA